MRKIFLIILLIILITSILLVSGAIIDLSGNDDGNWIGNSRINSASYSNRSNTLVMGINNNSDGTTQKLGAFITSLNKTIELNVTKDGWIVDRGISKVIYSPEYDVMFIFTVQGGNTDPKFGKFNLNTNTSTQINASCCIEINAIITDVEISPNTTTRPQRVYFSQATTPNSRFSAFHTELNATINYNTSLNDPSGLFFSIGDIAYDYKRSRVWFASQSTLVSTRRFGFFDEATNLTYNMTDKIQLTINGTIDKLTYDGLNDLVWFSARNDTTVNQIPEIFFFNITSNNSITKITDDPNQLLNSSFGLSIQSLIMNTRDNTLMVSGEGGLFGLVDIKNLRIVNLSNVDDGNWASGSLQLTYEVSNNNTYIFGTLGAYGIYGTSPSGNNAPTISQNYTNPLIPTVNNFFNITVELNGTENDAIIYVNFSIRASNGTTLLNNVNGTHIRNGNTYNYTSSTFVADDGGVWIWNYTTRDNTSATEVKRTGQFTIADNQAPTVNITFPFNNSLILYSNITFNNSITDNIRAFAMWYVLDSNFTTNTTVQLFHNFSRVLSVGNHNITFYANDTTGNRNSTFINFTITTDSSSPIISLTEPIGTKSSRTVTANYVISDNNAVNYCFYNVTRGSNFEVSDTAITNCATNTTLTFTVTLDANFVFNIWANDTSGNSVQTSSSFTVSTSSGTPSSSGGGGGGESTCRKEGEFCSSDQNCCSLFCSSNNRCVGKPSVFRVGEFSIIVSNSRGNNDPVDLRIKKGGSRSDYLNIRNNGTKNFNLDIICDDITELGVSNGFCNYVTLESPKLIMLPGAEEELDYKVNMPDNFNYGDSFNFGIRTRNTALGYDNIQRVKVTVSYLGYIFSLGDTLTKSVELGKSFKEKNPDARIIKIPNWFILLIVGILSFVGSNALGSRTIDGYKLWMSFLFSSGLLFIIFILMLIF